MISLSKPMMRIGVSGAALAMALIHLPVMAQTAAILRASAGLTTPVVSPQASLPRPGAVAPNAAGMTSASARALANQAAATNATDLALQANQAARAAALALAQAQARLQPNGVLPGGLVAGGLVPVANPTTAALDPTGLRVWQGASAPVPSGSPEAPIVTITQNSQRALLSWESFNVLPTTTLEFKQQPDWIVVNRIVANINPTTGRLADPANLRPSQILGTIKADGTVLVLNQNGVMFGATAQVNTRSLLVSSLELGLNRLPGAVANSTVPTTLAQRNTSFLQSGLLASNTLLSAMAVPAPGNVAVEGPGREGAISIAAGAAIASASGGFVIIAAPDISNAGQLRSEQGQVSLQSGRNVVAVASTGAAGSADPEVRGLVLSSSSLAAADTIVNAATGLIEAPRGLVSLGATVNGTVTSAGVLTSTTSVARNGKIVLSGAAVTLAPGATIAITPDGNGETIPQSAESVAAFKRSVIEIGGAQVRGVVTPSQISIGAGALIYAPSARVSIGATNDLTALSVLDTELSTQGIASSLLVDDGAVIDVGGIKNVDVPASRNSVQITPVKRNELRDTPNYRETTTDGSFTLNGATILVDARLSGVRADGVAWIGSPLIEAGSFFAQVGVTADELMTRGGDLTLGVRSFAQGSSLAAPNVTIRPRASIDVSGGWVSYAPGVVETSRLRTADGRIVAVGAADPNDNFVAVVAPFTAAQPRFGLSTSFANQVAQPTDFETGYTEGRDAGSLTIKASSTTLAGTIHAEAFAGTRQIATAQPGTIASTIASDGRTLQSAPSQLPSGGLLKIAAIGTGAAVEAGGADIIIYSASGPTPARPASEILLSDGFVSGLGLSGLTLQTSGRISFAAGSSVELQPGGALIADAGRTIRFDGSISVPSGRIAAHTYEVIPGSVFRTDDDLPSIVAPDADTAAPRLFDIEVNGLLSARGRWSNDFLVNDGVYLGSAYADGGSVSLEVAPRVLIPFGGSREFSADFSGSLRVNAGALIDVSAGGHVRPDGTLDLTAKGGDVALVNSTVYAPLLNRGNLVDLVPRSETIDAPGFITTPSSNRRSSLMPRALTAEVTIAPGSIVGQGFSGGGIFTLVTPDLNFGARADGSGTALPLDFFATSGFSAFSLTTYNSRLLPNVFSNGIAGNIALLDTETAAVNAGETLLLTQSLINSLLTDSDVDAVRNLGAGGDIKALLGTAVPVDAWDRRAVDLQLAGLTELNVAAGGTITASDGAVLTVSRLLNAGTIRLPGGTIRQNLSLPDAYLSLSRPAVAVSGLPGVDGLATLFGDRDANGLFDENAPNALGIRANASPNAPILSNAQLTTGQGFNRQVYFTASLGDTDGIVLKAGSITDVSGISIRNPRAAARPGGDQRIEGRIVNGGTIETMAAFASPDFYAEQPLFGFVRFGSVLPDGSATLVSLRRNALRLTAEGGSTIDLRGAADRYDLQTALGVFTAEPVWSDAGALTLNGGGTIAGSTVLANGGAPAAEGGKLTWLNPVLRQTDSVGQAANIVAADQITAAGFDSFTALNRLTSLGDAELTLGRGFYLTERPFDGDATTAAALNSYSASLATTGALAITAPYIQLESPQQTVLPTRGLPGASGTVTLNAGTLDIVGSIYADSSVSALTINATGDVRLTGVRPAILGIVGTSNTAVTSSLSGQFVVTGDLTITAAQIYPTTGTGSLQRDINALRLGQTPVAAPYLLASTGADATISFGRAAGPTPATPFSAGGNLLVQAANIEQGGVLRVPLGRLALGGNTPLAIGTSSAPAPVPATQSLVLGNNSITSVSANGLVIPYGTTTDLIEYFFAPASDERLFAPPAAELRLSGDSVAVDTTASVDASGGGDLYAYEFAAGVGGSRDVLSRFNSDPFSGNNGFQFPDARQVYAIVPSLSAAGAALIDPIYSSDYAALYAQSDAGRRVFLEAAPGLTAGWYTLLPARYALLPGGLRVVENVGEGPPALGQSAVLRDGSIIVGGRYGITGTGIESSQRRTFTVQSQATFRKFSNIQLTPASATFGNLATRDGLAVPQLPADAARLVLAPLTALAINARFLTNPAQGGRGSQVDISGSDFEIVVSNAPESPAGVVRLTTRDFANLNAASLLVGGLRRDNIDGTTSILASARTIRVANSEAEPLTAPEILLAVDGVGSAITIDDGSVIRATGNLIDPRTGDYVITPSAETGLTGIGGLVRVANGAERRLSRPGDLALANSLEDTIISIGEATLAGQSILLDSSRDLVIADNPLTPARPLITATGSLVLGGDDVHFTTAPSGYRGLVITPELETQFGAAQRLTIVTKSIIGFSAGSHSFNDLVIDARGIRPYGQATTPPPFPRDDQFDVAVADPLAPIAVTLNTRQFGFSNSDIARTPCGGVATIAACGSSGNTLTINATAINLGSGPMGIFGFDESVQLTASTGIHVEGAGTLDIGIADLRVTTPYFGDRALIADPRDTKVQPALTVFTTARVLLDGPGATPATAAAAPGSTLAFGTIDRPIESFSASGLTLRATAGTLDVRSTGDIVATGTTVLATPGFAKLFGEAADQVSVSAPGGTLSLYSATGNVALGSGVTLSIGGGRGNAGTLQLSAARGGVTLPGTIDAIAPGGGASLAFDSSTTGFDLSGFVASQGQAFTGDIRIRTGIGNLVLASGQTLSADQLRLTADTGQVEIAGTIDTSGVNGGNIGLFGTGGVTLAATALLDASADGYGANDTRAATGGTIEIGTAGTGSIVVAPGARIDVAARRPGARLVEQLRKDPLTLSDTLTYNYAQSDTGGIVAFRAPVLLNGDGEQTVDIRYAGSITGAREVSVEGYRIFDLASMARASCANADICRNEVGQIVLDLNAEAAIGNLPSTNRLASNIPGSIPEFIRNFDLAASNAGLGALTSADNFRARPGIQLEYAGDIVLASNWNLGAATVNVAAALADGLLAPSPQLGNGLNYVVPDTKDQLYYGVSRQGVPYTDFIYRVDGLATGEAGVLTLRAGGNLDIRGTITDGFFNFADQTAPEYLSFQLGGGDRGFRPAFNVSCGGFSIPCDSVFTPFFVTDRTTPPASTPDEPLVSISVNRLVRGNDSLFFLGNPIAPYSAAANSPGALGMQAGGAGDPIGSAVVAPLLPGGKAAASFSLRLVGGAAPDDALTLAVTADPLAVAASASGKVSVSGGSSYRAAPEIGPQRYAGDLELTNRDPNQGVTFVAAPAALRAALEQSEIIFEGSSYTRLTLSGAPTAVRTLLVKAAQDYIAANNIPADAYQFFGPPANPTIIAASFDLIAAILQSVSSGFADRIGGTGFTYAAPVQPEVTTLSNPNIATRSLVRTGTGTIDIAAAGDIDLTNGRAVFRAPTGRTAGSGLQESAQVGGAAVYTVGHLVDLKAQFGTDADGLALAIDPAFPAASTTRGDFQPAPTGVLNLNAIYAAGGGDIRLVSGRDVLARRDAWSEAFRGQASDDVARSTNAGADTQLWRVITTPGEANRFSLVTNIQVNPQLFSTGVGALGGGSVRVEAQRNISELTVVSDTSLTTARVGAVGQTGNERALALITFGGGNVDVRAGRNLLGGQLDVASGTLAVTAGNAIASSGRLRLAGTTISPSVAAPEDNLLRIRMADATADVSARGALTLAAITSTDGQGFFSQSAGVSLLANGDVRLTNAGKGVLSPFTIGNDTFPGGEPGAVLPGSLSAAALVGDLDLSAGVNSTRLVLVPSPIGQLKLFAGGDIVSVTLAMDDGDPSLTPGPLSAATPISLSNINLRTPGTRLFGFPVILPNTSDAERRLLHNERATHAGDPEPVRIFADGNLNQLTLALPKQARISAGGDIIDMVFIGQNLNPGDVTRITAGRDIVASSRVLQVPTGVGSASANLPVLQGNNFVLGGPGTLFVEAGRDLGPFFNSATVRPGNVDINYAGGILTVGNDYNPWLKPEGAKLYAAFGVGNGANYEALRTRYVDPANAGDLDGDLFVQAIDANGNRSPDRSKPVYATALVGWLVENRPDAITAAFGAPISLTDADVLPLLASLDAGVRTQFLADLPYLPIGGGINSPVVAIDRSNAAAPVLITGEAVATAPIGQRTNISGSTLIGWLAQNAPSVLTTRFGLTSTDIGSAYDQLTALPPLVQRQFLLDRVYFNELAAPSRPDGASSQQFIRGYRAVDLLFPGANGYTANDLGGTANGGTRVLTGNLDLRLATLETQRGGDITILGPGGRVLGGSVVSTATQAARRGAEVLVGANNLFQGFRRTSSDNRPAIRLRDIPLGFEGVLTLRGGSVRGFTDGDFLLNQSRLFTLAGGDVTLWSSNGDLNAGQGAKTSANNPPVVVRFDPNGFGTLDQAGTVAGAGIGAFQPAGVDKAPDVSLIAPAGTVDAGDAGVRASGNVFVAAARVANADNFKVGGTAFGNIATTVVDTGAAASANAASAAAAQAATAVNPSGGRAGDDRSRISVEVLGFAGRAGDDPCNLPANQRPANCPVVPR